MLAFYGGTGIVWEAWGITFAIVFALTLYACKTKTDFSFKSRLHSIFF
jgi:FtsH-binding integral membrane protein